VDTYQYFGEPVYTYSLKSGINDGFLTPFKVKRIKTTMDDYRYTSDDEVVEGEIEQGKLYEEADFNRVIEIKEREAERVRIMLKEIKQSEKAIIFCANQAHAAAVRDLVNQMKQSKDPNYCVRVTANDGERGEQFLREFQDNEKVIPTILTTSQKLSTGVDARNVRAIVLMRPVNSMIEFKQIVGRGTRLFDGKEYFTILDFVDAYKHFSDPEWDGDPIEEVATEKEPSYMPHQLKSSELREGTDEEVYEVKKKIVVKLRDGKEREIQHMIATSFWGADGKPVTTEEFLQALFGALPEFFKNEDELRTIWSDPSTRKVFLNKLADHGYAKEQLDELQKLVAAEDSDLFDVLAYVSFALKPITRKARVAGAFDEMTGGLSPRQDDFLEFVLNKYIELGVDELSEEKLPQLLNLKYHAISDAETILGGVENIRSLFFGMQKSLYRKGE
jgi:type I restriction enzyme R subunit